MDKVDWNKIKTEYISDSKTSYRSLSEKYGVANATLQKRAHSEKWPAERAKYKKSVVKKAVQKLEKKEADRLFKIGDMAFKALDVAEKAITDDEQFNRYIITEGLGGGATVTEERIYKKVDTKALRELTTTLKELTGIIRNVYGMPSQSEAEAQRIAREKLELDKKKAQMDEDADRTIEVILRDAGPEEWNE